MLVARMTMRLPDGGALDYTYGPFDEVDAEAVEYLFTEGNYSCDCNRSLLLRRGGHDVPEMPCGEDIELVRFRMGAEP